MKYCRYCSWCVYGDAYYCGCHDKLLKRVNVPTNCKDYHESELGDVETGRRYTPRIKDGFTQISMEFNERKK